jgi:hypothetical protein
VLGSTERFADLRAYYAKHIKSDRLDCVLLARLPLLHPEGLHHERGLGPGDPLRRATKVHSTLVKRRAGHRLSLLVWSTPKTHERWSVPFPQFAQRTGRVDVGLLRLGNHSRTPLQPLPKSPLHAPAPNDESGGLVVELFAVRHPEKSRAWCCSTPRRCQPSRGLANIFCQFLGLLRF